PTSSRPTSAPTAEPTEADVRDERTGDRHGDERDDGGPLAGAGPFGAGHRPGPVEPPRRHGQVHPLAALEGADEQGARGERHRPRLPDPAGIVPSCDPGDAEALELAPEHLAVTNHEPRDRGEDRWHA